MSKKIFVLLMMCVLSFQTSSAKPKENEEEKAIVLVSQQKEVKEWMKKLDMARIKHKHPGNAGLAVADHKGHIYTVQAFESFPDHNATFNWYKVDVRTNKVIGLPI